MSQPDVFARTPALKRPPGRAGWAQTFEPVLADLRATLRAREPGAVVAAAGAVWKPEDSTIHMELMGRACSVSWPELIARDAASGEPLSAEQQGLLLYYLAMADGSGPAGRWIAFRELPDGWLYHQAFQGYSGDLLARSLGDDLAAFERAAVALGGARLDFGDAAYAFICLPRLHLAVFCWLGDEEFAGRAQVLFDAGAARFLPTDGLAVLGGRLVRRILALSGDDQR